MKDLVKSVADEIADVSIDRPHLVLLGAGASRAAFPRGERNGKRLPVMADFFEIAPIADVLASGGLPHSGRNFEELYSELTRDPARATIREALERAVFDYFSSLELPDEPTLFDHLVLSLRPKDVIATFNWDPFLIQAVRRNGHVGGAPRLLFLHGNVLEAYSRGMGCTVCVAPSARDAGNPSSPASCFIPLPKRTTGLTLPFEPLGEKSSGPAKMPSW